MRALLPPSLVALCVAAGCVEDVPIAAECLPGQAGPCIVELDGGDLEPPLEDASPGKPPPSRPVDAQTPPDASAPDAGSEVVPPLPPIANYSFEFSSPTSVAGEVTTISDLTNLTTIAPWYTCQLIGNSLGVSGVRAETALAAITIEGAPTVAVAPNDGKTFITIAYSRILPVPLIQQLGTPLRAGQRYAFAIDTLATRGSSQLSLEVRSNEQGCLGGTARTLFRSEPITSSSWSTLCVSFTPATDVPYLVLAAEPTPGTPLVESGLLPAPRLAFDRIREATAAECPEL